VLARRAALVDRLYRTPLDPSVIMPFRAGGRAERREHGN
jgi:hypothetical protein